MTICIAAICEKGQKIIVASDRMITSDLLSQQFEHNIPKMENISKSCLAVTAGHALAPREIFSKIRVWASSKANPFISEVVAEVKSKFNELRIRNAEEKHIKSRGFEDVNDFYQKSRTLPQDIYFSLNEQIADERLGVEILIAGVDVDGAHIHWVRDPGSSDCYDTLCYSAVGSGEPHALHTFIAEEFDNSFPLKKALFIVYEAKKNAQNAPGVGEKSDFWIIDKESIKEVKKSTLDELEKIYNKKKLVLDKGNAEIFDDLNKLGVD